MRLSTSYLHVWSARSTLTLLGRLLAFGSVLVAVAFIVRLSWTGRQLRNDARMAAQDAVQVAELRGSIAYLNEQMVMSARLAAASGERVWMDRYAEVAPKLDAAIIQVAALGSAKTRAEVAGTTGEAHRDLVAMEHRALAFVGKGDLASANALLDGPEFAYIEDVYASGVEVFGQDLASFHEARTTTLTNRAWVDALGLALAVVVLITSALSIYGHSLLRRARIRITAVARTDALTELPNRRQFYEVVEATLAGPAAMGCTLLLIDLDRFKPINDLYGHPAGDEILRLAAARLRLTVREGDLIARLGGDEFGLLLSGASAAGPPGHKPEAIAARIVAVCADPFVLEDGITMQLGASVGIAVMEAASTAVSDLMHRADIALSKAKTDGRNCFRAFEPGLDAALRSRALLEGDLRRAVIEGVIVPYYQPLVDLRTGMMIGVEMLARWPDPARGLVSPDTFIPLAEELDLIGILTVHLLRRACLEAAQWPAEIKLACNLSPLQLQDVGLSGAIRDVFTETRFSPERLELEVTESALVGDLALARRSLEQLKTLGVRLALDDFGTGYSSLRQLQTLPFDKIKIDRSFVAAMVEDAESSKIVAAVVGLGHSLGMTTVAEGVETEATAVLLHTLGCDIGQGWLYGRPVPADRIAAMFDDLRVVQHLETVAAAMA